MAHTGWLWLAISLASSGCSGRSERPHVAPTLQRDATSPPSPMHDAAASADPRSRAVQLALGPEHTCALLSDGAVRCWGLGDGGRLGTGSTASLGDDELVDRTPPIELGGKAVAIAAGRAHTCALLDSGHVRCWGHGAHGQLGYGNSASIGDDETPASAGDVPIGERVTAITAGNDVTCALLASGAIRCWGDNRDGRLGYGPRFSHGALGDNEAIESQPAIRLARPVVEISNDQGATCARFDDGGVKCWGDIAGSPYATADGPSITSDIALGAPAARLSSASIACAITTAAHARCWGSSRALGGSIGGYQNGEDGFDPPAAVGDLPIPGQLVAIAVSHDFGCALVKGGEVRCWGASQLGQLGSSPGAFVDVKRAVRVDVGAAAVAVAVGQVHACVITEPGGVRCWGYGKNGRLGYGSTDNVGEKRPPSAAGDVPLLP